MPSGKVHDQITLVAAVIAGPTWWLLTSQPQDLTVGLTLVGSTLFSGMMLSPDLDLNSSIYHRWGPLCYLWWPYQKLIPHRSRFSHSFVLAPVLRVIYFLALAWLVMRLGTWVAAQFFNFDRNALSREATDLVVNLWRTHPQHFAMLALGIFLGSALHVAADFIWTGIKRHTPPPGPFHKRRRARH